MRCLAVFFWLVLGVAVAARTEDAPRDTGVPPVSGDQNATGNDVAASELLSTPGQDVQATDTHGPEAHATNAEVVAGPDELPEKVEVPNGLTIQKAEELLIKNNLAVIAARYGVDSARA